MNVLPTCMCVVCHVSTCAGQKRELLLLELELQMVVSYQVGARSSGRAATAVNPKHFAEKSVNLLQLSYVRMPGSF